MIASPKIYFLLLKLTLLTIVLAFGRAVFDPSLGQIVPYPHPDRVPLAEGNFLNGQAAIAKSMMGESWFDLKGYQYQYQRYNRTFEIKSYYIEDSHGEVAVYAKTYLFGNKDSKTWAQKQDQNGSYRVFEFNQTAYLSACINTKGPTTANRDEFFVNRNQHDFQLHRLIPVVIGRQNPRDNRCLWVTVSTPIRDGESFESVAQELGVVWHNWYRSSEWSAHFPPLG